MNNENSHIHESAGEMSLTIGLLPFSWKELALYVLVTLYRSTNTVPLRREAVLLHTREGCRAGTILPCRPPSVSEVF